MIRADLIPDYNPLGVVKKHSRLQIYYEII